MADSQQQHSGGRSDDEDTTQKKQGQDVDSAVAVRSQPQSQRPLNTEIRRRSSAATSQPNLLPSPFVHSNSPAHTQGQYLQAVPHAGPFLDQTFHMAQLGASLPQQFPIATWAPAHPQIPHMTNARWTSPDPAYVSSSMEFRRLEMALNTSSPPYNAYPSPVSPPQPRPGIYEVTGHPRYPGDITRPHGFMPTDAHGQSVSRFIAHAGMAGTTRFDEPRTTNRRVTSTRAAPPGTRFARGPPKKPRQSGHALWVGNLPPAITIMDLKEHFSRDATHQIQSIKLITKTNCAFVNYKTHESCVAALARFHDSVLQDRRVVCRLRRSSANEPVNSGGKPQLTRSGESQTGPASPTKSQSQAQTGGEAAIKPQRRNLVERFFILKSLTTEDLEVSYQEGTWATQSHNEGTLNEAYGLNSKNVYLFFSVNKSSEYFGYGRMASPIGEAGLLKSSSGTQAPEKTGGTSSAPKRTPREAQASYEEAGIRYIFTVAGDHAPQGIVIDDIARDIVFWEAEAEDKDNAVGSAFSDFQEARRQAVAAQQPAIVSSTASTSNERATAPVQQAASSSFRVEWLSTTKVPFYRTRGLRNAWNSNREVKIARDGTEVETSVARQLRAMFHTMSP